jgi:NAD(P)-dependent dehydrogenase (short-subunit alcohol dehydrogenase family)
MFNDDSFEEWTDVFKTNTAGPYFVTMAFLSLLEKGAKARDGQTSSVINISSGAGSTKVTPGLVSGKD